MGYVEDIDIAESINIDTVLDNSIIKLGSWTNRESMTSYEISSGIINKPWGLKVNLLIIWVTINNTGKSASCC